MGGQCKEKEFNECGLVCRIECAVSWSSLGDVAIWCCVEDEVSRRGEAAPEAEVLAFTRIAAFQRHAPSKQADTLR